jgi:acetate kinase
MKILVLNSGSSSIKYQVFESDDWTVIASGTVTRIGEAESDLEGRWITPDGGSDSCRVTLPIPNHQEGLERVVGRLRDSGVLADIAELGAVGHGTSHGYVAKRAEAFLGKPLTDCNLITLHLGNGASAAAIRGGESLDTSMGLTPLEGLVMGTRCGDIDPAIHFYLGNKLGLDLDALDDLLNRQSGLLGLCGVNDMREIHRRADDGDEEVQLAIGIFCHRLRKYLGAYYALLGRVDAVVFTGGIGENDADVRARTCDGLEDLGIRLDASANLSSSREERAISDTTSRVEVLVIPTNEELQIALESFETVTGNRLGDSQL